MIILSDKSVIPMIFRATTNYLNPQGYRAPLPDLIIEDDGYMYVTCPNPEVADVGDAVVSEYFTDVYHDDIPGRFRASLKYAADTGYAFAFPNFHQASGDKGLVYGTNLIKSEAIEIRDVLASEFGDIAGDDIPRRIKTAGNYAIRNNFAWGCPNFHQRRDESGLVYGTALFKSGFIKRIPVKFVELFSNPVDFQSLVDSSEHNAISLNTFKEKIDDIGIGEGFKNVAGYFKEKVTGPLAEVVTKVFKSTEEFIRSGDVNKHAKHTALNAARQQKENGSSEELCADAVRDIMFGVALIIQAPTPTVPNPYAIAVAGSAISLSKWACHETYKNES
ncbi:hypothetical protein ABES38_08765 [Bacillus gobiensis]|uniref:hypothetical protein n=1 Tax=Bacillus gobiensis TaxID=1441095 RepID=UPI003D1EDDCC